MIASGRKKLALKDYARAKESYRLAVLLNPRVKSDCILDFEKMLSVEGSNIALRLSLSDFYLKIGEVDSALTELEEILDIAPDMVPVYNLLGEILMGNGEISETINLLERALKHDVKDTSLTEMLAGAYLKRGDVLRSIALYEEVLAVSAKDKNILRTLGDLYSRAGDEARSALSYLKLFEVEPQTYEEVVNKLSLLHSGRGSSFRVREMIGDVHLRGGRPDRAVFQFRELFGDEKHSASLAVKKYREALKSFPGNPDLLNALAQALISSGEYTEAAQEYRELFKLGGDFQALAIDGYLKILKKYPDHILAHKYLGEAYDLLSKFEDALDEYRTVIRLDASESDFVAKRCREILKVRPDLTSLHQVLGDIAIIRKDFKRATSEAEEILAVDPKNLDAFVLLADAQKGALMYSKASDSYSMALMLDPYNISLHKSLEGSRKLEIAEAIKAVKARIKDDQWRMSLHLDLAKLYLELEQWDASQGELQQALRDQARAPFAYNLFGLSLKEQGKFELAVSQFKKALESLPRELQELQKTILLNLGLTYEALGKVEDAIFTYQAVRDIDMDFGATEQKIKRLTSVNPLSLRNKMFALVLRELGGIDLIEVWGRDGRPLNQKHVEDMGISFSQTHNEKGFEFMMKGLYKSAEERFLQAIALDARLASALNNLAVIYAHQGKLDDARAKLEAALLDDPKHAVLHNNLAVISHLQGEGKAAELQNLRALSIDADLSTAHLNLGDAYYLAGNAKQAISSWEKVKNFSVVSELACRRLRYKVQDRQ